MSERPFGPAGTDMGRVAHQAKRELKGACCRFENLWEEAQDSAHERGQERANKEHRFLEVWLKGMLSMMKKFPDDQLD